MSPELQRAIQQAAAQQQQPVPQGPPDFTVDFWGWVWWQIEYLAAQAINRGITLNVQRDMTTKVWNVDLRAAKNTSDHINIISRNPYDPYR